MRDAGIRFGDRFRIVVAAIVTAAAVITVVILHVRADSARQAQVRVEQITAAADSLATVPLVALYASFGQGERLLMQSESTIKQQLALLPETGVRSQLARIRLSTNAYASGLWGILPLLRALERRSGNRVGLLSELRLVPSYARVQERLVRDIRVLKDATSGAERSYAAAAQMRNTDSYIGSVLAVLFSCVGFSAVFRSLSRSRREAQVLAEENARLLIRTRVEAETDALTGLPNRRKLMADLENTVTRLQRDGRVVLALYDLNGFKDYNDTFGHPAGDHLLARLGGRLAAAATPDATAYRMGGDEFCVVWQSGESSPDKTLTKCRDALALSEPGINISSSHGRALIPDEAQTVEHALRIADQRLYAAKALSKQARAEDASPTTTPRPKVLKTQSELVRIISSPGSPVRHWQPEGLIAGQNALPTRQEKACQT